MNTIEQNICDAIETLVNKAITQADYDKTIQAVVINCVDETIGKYKVQYQDSTFYAYSGSSDIIYTAGATVYVLIPGNDMSADKTILGTTKKLGINYVSTIETDEAYQIVGNNVISSSDTFGLKSYGGKQVKVLYSKDYSANQNLLFLNQTAINEYIKNQSTIICGGVIRNALPAEQQFKGNFGILFALNFKDNATEEIVTRYYTIDVDKMSGNPYKILYNTRQYSAFNIDGENFIDVDSISIFCYGFPNSKNDCEEDIFIKDIELCGAEALSEDDISNYTITFVTPQGTYFDSTSLSSDTRTIQAEVRVKGKVIDNDSQSLPFYWFIEHTGITSESPYYNKYGGQGWKCLNNFNVIAKATDSDPEVVEWIPGSYIWTVKKSDIVAKEVKYKCSVVYDGTIISKTITIKNLASAYDITIESDQGTQFYFDIGYPTLKCLVNGVEAPTLTYSWAVTNNVGTFESMEETPTANAEYLEAYNNYYNLLNDIEAERLALEPNKERLTWYRNELKAYDTVTRVDGNTIYHLAVNTITDFSIYKCTVYQGNLYLGTASITLVNSLNTEGRYTIIINNGNCVYKYDENGVSPASSAVDEPIEIPSLTFNVYDNLGNIIDDEVVRHSDIQWIVPIENTMIEIPDSYETYEEDLDRGVRIYKDFMSFSYNIASRYDVTKTNNTIQVMIDYNDMILSAETTFVFTKEGEAGTNGTDFFCRVVPNTISGVTPPVYPIMTELSDYSYSLNYTPQQANRFFRVQLWHDETKILDSVTSAKSTEGKTATIKWSILKNKYSSSISDNSSLIVNESTGIFTYQLFNYYSPANIVKAEVEYDGVTYYATIPLITVKLKNDSYRLVLKDNTGFNNVLYSSDGKTPRYDNTKPFEIIVTQQISEYWEDVSLKQTSAYAVTYDWDWLNGRIYEDEQWEYIQMFTEVVTGSSTLYANQCAIKPKDDYDGQCVTNALVCIVKKSNTEIGRIHIPIYMLLNRYGNSAINGWDGNSVNISEDEGFILAPQVGAGIKESDNSFTGVLMGKIKETNKSGEEVGLFGYAKGVRSIFLDAYTGKAVFGANGKGQITIDPSSNKAEIYSGNYYYNNDGTGTGMKIDLTTPYIKFGSGNFEVDENGFLTAKGGGSIAGWQITNTELYSPSPYSSRKLTLDSANTRIYSGLKTSLNSSTVGFYLSPDGLGIVSSGGGKFLLDTSSNTPTLYSNNHSSLTSSAVGFYLSQDGLSLKSSNSGTTSSLVFSTAGEPEIYSNSKSSLTNTRTGFYIGGSGISLGSKCYISSEGILRLGIGAVANTGKHWEINGDSSDSYIKYGDMGDTNSVYISTGMISLGKKFYADNTGVVRVGNGAVAASGKYWTIDGGSGYSYIGYNATESNLSTSSNEVSIGSEANTTSVYLGTDGIRLGKKFAVDHNGNVLAKYLTANSGGTIGGWTISSNKLSATDGYMELRSNGTLKGGSSYEWSINSAGTATFNRLVANSGGTIAGWTITSTGLYNSNSSVYITPNSLTYGSGFTVNSSGAITSTSGTIGGWTIGGSYLKGGALTLNSTGAISGNNWSITAAGLATFSNISVTGGSITLGGTTLNSNGTNLTAGKTTVGSKSLQTYVEDLAVGKLTAADVTITASLDVGNNTYYLRMGQGTKNPEVSGLNIGSQGIRVGSNHYGQTNDIRVISSINDLKVSVGHSSIIGISTPLISSITVSIDYSYRDLQFYSGICCGFTDSESNSKSDTDS